MASNATSAVGSADPTMHMQAEWESYVQGATAGGDDLFALLSETQAAVPSLMTDAPPTGEVDIVSLLSEDPDPDQLTVSGGEVSPFSAASYSSTASPLSSAGGDAGLQPSSVKSTGELSLTEEHSTVVQGISPVDFLTNGCGPFLSENELALFQAANLADLTADRQSHVAGLDAMVSGNFGVSSLEGSGPQAPNDITIDLEGPLPDDNGIFDCNAGSPHGSELSANSSRPSLVLTAEERQLLAQEGMELPTDLPLTKAEEKSLKKVRRKIKNKMSAQDSRRRKKEYIDGLEERVRASTQNNRKLQKRVQLLEDTNKNLIDHLRRLQAIVTAIYPVKPAQTTVAVVVLSFAFFLVPGFTPGNTAMDVSMTYVGGQVRSRTLLAPEISAGRLDDGEALHSHERNEEEDEKRRRSEIQRREEERRREKEAIERHSYKQPDEIETEPTNPSNAPTHKAENRKSHQNHGHKRRSRFLDET